MPRRQYYEIRAETHAYLQSFPSDRGELACGDQDVIRHVLFHRRYQGWTGGHMVHAQCMRSACGSFHNFPVLKLRSIDPR
jgi:hypothetical protein